MAENDSSGLSMWDRLVMQPEPVGSEKTLKDKFVTEYLHDFDAWAAAIRVGFNRAIAATYAQVMLENSYVRNEIQRRQLAEVDSKEAAKQKKRAIEAALLREAHYKGPGATHSGRVMALTQLAKINDMDAPIKTKTEVTHKGGIMIAPAIASISDWEKEAVENQAKLMKEARN